MLDPQARTSSNAAGSSYVTVTGHLHGARFPWAKTVERVPTRPSTTSGRAGHVLHYRAAQLAHRRLVTAAATVRAATGHSVADGNVVALLTDPLPPAPGACFPKLLTRLEEEIKGGGG
jgi:hypothetical protein